MAAGFHLDALNHPMEWGFGLASAFQMALESARDAAFQMGDGLPRDAALQTVKAHPLVCGWVPFPLLMSG